MATDHSYYDSLKRRYKAADKEYWENFGKKGVKSGGEVLLEATPSNPSELRQYIDVLGIFSEEIGSEAIVSIYREAVNLLESWEQELPGDPDLVRAREKLKIVKKRVNKKKERTPLCSQSSSEFPHFLSHLSSSFPGGRH